MGEGWEGKEARKINKQENTEMIFTRDIEGRGEGRRRGGEREERGERGKKGEGCKHKIFFPGELTIRQSH